MHLHETEKPIMLEGAVEPVGYRVLTKDFDFSAIYETDGSVNTYVEWGDDQGGDMANHHSMAEAKRYLEALLKASEPEAPPVKVDLTKAVNESVISALEKTGQENTVRNRMMILQNMYTTLSREGSREDVPIMHAIEDEIIRLSDEILG